MIVHGKGRLGLPSAATTFSKRGPIMVCPNRGKLRTNAFAVHKMATEGHRAGVVKT